MAWLYKQQGSAVWWVGWRANGKQYLRSTGERDEESAKKILAQYNVLAEAKKAGCLTEEFYHSMIGQKLSSVSLSAALGDWLTECGTSSANKTASRYGEVARDFKGYLGATDTAPLLREVGTDDVRGFLSAKRKILKPSTCNVMRKILSAFFNWAVGNGQLRDNPVKSVKTFAADAEAPARRALTLEEVRAVYDQAPDDFFRWLIIAAFYTGQRMGDLITLRTSNVDLGAGVLKLVQRKRRNGNARPVTVPLAKPLQDFLAGLPVVKGNGYLWPEQAKLYLERGSPPFSNQFRDLILAPCGLATKRDHGGGKNGEHGRSGRREVSEVSFHCLRHTFVSLLKERGANQAVAKELAGHSSDAVNDMYTHIPLETLVSAIGRLPKL